MSEMSFGEKLIKSAKQAKSHSVSRVDFTASTNVIRFVLIVCLLASVSTGCNGRQGVVDESIAPTSYSPIPLTESAPEHASFPTEQAASPDITPPVPPSSESPALPAREEIQARYSDLVPTAWGEAMDGIMSVLPTSDKAVAITLDACGWGVGSGYDEPLMEFLISQSIPATLFISGKWIEDNPGMTEYLAGFEFFEIENHGYLHKPLSVTGKSQYGIAGTGSVLEVYDEIEDNARRIEELTGRRPVFFRSGTAYYDDVAVRIAADLGQTIAGYTIAADGGATFTVQQMISACKNPVNGAILLFHMNRPESDICEGIKAIYSELTEKGYAFLRIDDFIEN